MFKLSTSCKPVFQMKTSEKSPADVGDTTGERNCSSRNTKDFLLNLNEKWEGRLYNFFFWRLNLKMKINSVFYFFCERGSCPSLAIVGKIILGARMMLQIPGNQTFQMH